MLTGTKDEGTLPRAWYGKKPLSVQPANSEQNRTSVAIFFRWISLLVGWLVEPKPESMLQKPSQPNSPGGFTVPEAPVIRKKTSRDMAGSIKVVEMRPSQNTSRLKRNSSLKRTVSEVVYIPPLDDTWEIPQSGCCFQIQPLCVGLEAGKAHVNVVCLILGKAFFRRKASLDSIYLESFV